VVPDDEPVWRALADPTRRAILDALRTGPRTTSALAGGFPTTRFAVMKHLAVLVEAGLVSVERRGRERLNHLNPVPLRQTYERWVRPAAAPAAEVALRLAERAEDVVRTGADTAGGRAVGPYGLDVRARHVVRADRDRTWTALLDLADWWPQCWPDGARLVFEPHVGGRLGTTFGAALDDGGRGALWGVVSGLHPGRELRVDGSMDIPGPVAGQWRMLLEPAPDAVTVVTVEHRVLGPVDDETAAGFTRGWPGTLARLAERAESAEPVPGAGS
jgi:DNA-binding transcriptional ArsR family regulator